ncbi:hypothetical protein LAV_00221 [Sphingobium phage Lacusarx]|uniref:Uncharacterized protein n=1 Tax=Sphingobium phage Lacusarx TaxID=1980139 RepID=A0A1W6DXL0_9CAUD|nr:hypothetical protein FDH44_gp082 [Sphingobium phage Lacusarx]ARK07596.1 hypothetical protein LAV_00221 [Sphingobium phage Lacusarx]
MDMNRIIGTLVSGFACKAYALALGVWIASEAMASLSNVAARVAGVM